MYRYCREVDDAVDEAPNPSVAREAVAEWSRELDRVFTFSAETETGRALQTAVRDFSLLRQDIEDVLAGVSRDIETRRYETFEELYRYCYLVASAVGMSAVRIFGRHDDQARHYAESLGIALQLTNIIRDVGEDARRGRIYLPMADLHRFEVSEEDVITGRLTPNMRDLLMFQAGRAHHYFEVARAALPRHQRKRLVSAEAMRTVYFELLRSIEASGFDVFGERVRVSSSRKARLAVERLLARAFPL